MQVKVRQAVGEKSRKEVVLSQSPVQRGRGAKSRKAEERERKSYVPVCMC